MYCINFLTTKLCPLLTISRIFDYNTRMARPRKYGDLRMDTDLRIPLTTEQKTLLDAATADVPEGKASWARAILLQAARRKLAKSKSDKRERS
jgi:hypothetical protein